MEEMLGHMAYGFSVALASGNVGYALLGALVGTLIGVLPGIGPVSGIAVLIPVLPGLRRSAGRWYRRLGEIPLLFPPRRPANPKG